MSERRRRTPPADDAERVQRLTLDIPKALHKRLKRIALEEEMTIPGAGHGVGGESRALGEGAAVRG